MIDPGLEKRNFKKAGEILANVWNELVLDKFPVYCEYLENAKCNSMPYCGLASTVEFPNICCKSSNAMTGIASNSSRQTG